MATFEKKPESESDATGTGSLLLTSKELTAFKQSMDVIFDTCTKLTQKSEQNTDAEANCNSSAYLNSKPKAKRNVLFDIIRMLAVELNSQNDRDRDRDFASAGGDQQTQTSGIPLPMYDIKIKGESVDIGCGTTQDSISTDAYNSDTEGDSEFEDAKEEVETETEYEDPASEEEESSNDVSEYPESSELSESYGEEAEESDTE